MNINELNSKQLARGVLLALLTIFFTTTSLLAQSAVIRGEVTDAQTGEPLVGANVVLASKTTVGAATNVDGEYVIRGINPGDITLIARYIGYKSVEKAVSIEGGQNLTLNFELSPETVTGEEVVVSAQREGQVQAINQQLTSDQIVNVVSEAKISEMPDFNAAQAIGRLPGVSTQKSSGEANKVVIRGLSPEYNSIQIEGVRLSATGSSQMGLSSNPGVGGNLENNRSVDLSMVSPYMIRMISVYKSLTPDMNANTIGGAVNMELRKAPAEPNVSAMYQQGYTDKSNTIGNYRAVLSGSNRFFNDKLGVYALGNIEAYDRNADNMSAGYDIASGEVNPETGYRPVKVNSVSFNRHLETRRRYGANLILDYDLPDGSIKFVNMYARINSDYTEHQQTINYNNGRMEWQLRQGENITEQQMHSLKLDYDFDFMSADLSASYTSSNNLLDEAPIFNFNQTNALTVPGERDNMVPQELTTYTNYQGASDVILRSGNLFTNDYQEEKFSYKADFKMPFNIGQSANGFFKFGGQLENQSNTTDQETPYLAFNGSATGEGQDIQTNMMRTIMERYGLTVDNTGSLTGTSFKNSDDDLYDSFLGDRYGEMYYVSNPNMLVDIINYIIGQPRFDASNRDFSSGAQGGWYDGPYQALANDYEFNEDYYATYAMTKVNFWDFMFIGGVRYEKVDQEYFAYNARDMRNPQAQIMYDTTSTTSNENFLPMAQIKYTPVDWMNVRYSYTQTLARPDYTSLSPKFTITQGNSIYTGNPGLEPARAFNHDLSISFHSNKLGLFSVGAFYKTIEDFVYTASYQLNAAQRAGIDDASNYTFICNDYYRQNYPVGSCDDGDQLIGPTDLTARVYRPINNPNEAVVKGIEFDFQTNLWYLPKPLNNIVMGVNYSRIYSELDYPFYKTETRLVQEEGQRRPTPVPFLVDSSFTGRLIDQPNHVLNSYIGYDYKGLSTRLSITFESNSATNNGGEYPENDGYTTDYFRIDFSARQKLPFADSELFLDVTNLNDERTSQVQKSTEGFRGIQNYGLTANLGIRVRY